MWQVYETYGGVAKLISIVTVNIHECGEAHESTDRLRYYIYICTACIHANRSMDNTDQSNWRKSKHGENLQTPFSSSCGEILYGIILYEGVTNSSVLFSRTVHGFVCVIAPACSSI